MRYALAVMIILPWTVLFSAEIAITENNWRNHPSIVEIRQIFSDTEEGIKKKTIQAGTLIERKTARGGTEKFKMYKNEDGHVFKCTREGGSEESSYSMSHYYDSRQQLRFVFVKVSSVNGAAVEYRIYFDASSKRIWHNREYKSKERYPFTEIWPDDLILFNPWSMIPVD